MAASTTATNPFACWHPFWPCGWLPSSTIDPATITSCLLVEVTVTGIISISGISLDSLPLSLPLLSLLLMLLVLSSTSSGILSLPLMLLVSSSTSADILSDSSAGVAVIHVVLMRSFTSSTTNTTFCRAYLGSELRLQNVKSPPLHNQSHTSLQI